MRASLLFAAAIVASVPLGPVPLSSNAPQLLIENADCTAAERQAKVLAADLGFARTRMNCRYRLTIAELEGRAPAHTVSPNNLITYSLFSGPPTPPQVSSWFEVSSDVPFVAASADIIAYTKLDALLMRFSTDKMLETAFALEAAGVSRSDMTSPPGYNQLLEIRVRPITPSRIEQIARILASYENPPNIGQIGFVKDCDGVTASLGALALEETRRRANVVARAAQTELLNPIGVVDPGGGTTDTVCGLGADATTAQLAVAAENAHLDGPGNSHFYATFVRSVRAAWRVRGLMDGPGTPWEVLEELSKSGVSGFIANGIRVNGGALVNNVQPNRVTILLPDWSYDSLLRSSYSKYVTYVDFGIGRLEPSVTFDDRNAQELQKRAAEFRTYFSTLAKHLARPADLSFHYSQTNCGPAIDAALFHATQDALSKAGGKNIRYLQQSSIRTFGSVSCAYKSTGTDDWSNNPAWQPGASTAWVVAAY